MRKLHKLMKKGCSTDILYLRKILGKSFSLVEMLVVILIISVLASLMMPALKQTLDQANQISCANNLKQWGTAFALYINDHDGMSVTCFETMTPSWNGSQYWWWFKRLPFFGYIDAQQIDKTINNGNIYSMHCPALRPAEVNYFNYMKNRMTDYPSTSKTCDNSLRWKNHSKTLLLIDGMGYSSSVNYYKWFWYEDSPTSTAREYGAHNGLANILFLDYHIGTSSFVEKPTNTYDKISWSPYF